MAEERVVLVTGATGYWGSRVAAELMAQPDCHVIGLDDRTAETAIKGLDFVTADFRDSAVVDLLREEAVDTVCHLAFLESDRASEEAFDSNVLGTMKLLGMCAEAGVRQVVFKSSTMVYGARPDNSLYLSEDHPLNGSKTYGYVRDLVEIEEFCDKFRTRAPGMATTSLRFAQIVGPAAVTPLTRFFRDEEAFVLLGFDPLMLIIHEQDVARAFAHAMTRHVSGAVNVAAEGTMPLWKVMALAGKLTAPVFHPMAYAAASLLGPRYAPLDLDYLRYPCVAGLEKMRSVLGFVPGHAGEETLREFASRQRLRSYARDTNNQAENGATLRDTIERRRRAREQAAQSGGRRLQRAPAARRARKTPGKANEKR
ncbi:MAG: NAD-dependent epimerase/dehydratase family protein [Rudaea sp.]